MLARALGSGVALIFLRAVYHMTSEFTEFTGFVADYRILPAALVRPASVALVAAEVAVVLGTVIPGGLPFAMGLGAGLFLMIIGLATVHPRYAVLLDEHGMVRAKGLVNSREQFASLFNAFDMKTPPSGPAWTPS